MPALPELNDDEMEEQANMADASKRAKEKQKRPLRRLRRQEGEAEEGGRSQSCRGKGEEAKKLPQRGSEKAEEEELKKQTLSPAELCCSQSTCLSSRPVKPMVEQVQIDWRSRSGYGEANENTREA